VPRGVEESLVKRREDRLYVMGRFVYSAGGASTASENRDIDRRDALASTIAVLFADLAEFIEHHRPCGTLTGDATRVTEVGYTVTVTCSCGVVFQRWIGVEEAAHDLEFLSRLN